MSFEICYVFPSGDDHLPLAYRFVSSYLENPPACEHDTIILTDRGNESQSEDLFSLLPNVRVFTCPSDGRDLQRYQLWCEQSKADCVMMLGGSSYCRRPGWGLRALTTFNRLGSANLYGACGHTGVGPVHKHLRTTGIWCSPTLMNRYPLRVTHAGQRYEMEHGQSCITGWVLKQGMMAYEVTFAVECDASRFNCDPNGYARGSQTNLLIGDRLTMPPYMPFP